jgi:hypothetical protein
MAKQVSGKVRTFSHGLAALLPFTPARRGGNNWAGPGSSNGVGNLTVAIRGPIPYPGFAVFPSITLRVNETAAELAVRPSQRFALLPPDQIDTQATRHARRRAAEASTSGSHLPKKGGRTNPS